MDLLEVLHPEISTYVRYKRIEYADVDAFVDAHKSLKKDEYVAKVLETVVFNLRSEVSDVLRTLDRPAAREALLGLYNGCIMLNPGLDVDEWLRISNSSALLEKSKEKDIPPPQEELPPIAEEKPKKRGSSSSKKKITRAKFLGLESYLRENIIGQDEAISSVVSSLKRTIAGLGDEERPLGVFLFAGASGVGKTELAKKLHEYLFSDEYDIVRVDCGEYQHKHENQKLIGSPPGYVGHGEGGHLTNQLKRNNHTVVLLDEVEKAHPDLWNTFLRVFDEGMITDGSGKNWSFRDSIIIMTTNLGNKEIVDDIMNTVAGFGGNVEEINFRNTVTPKRRIVEKHAAKAIRKQFRPEFMNRIDRVVVFNHLSGNDLTEIAELELAKLEAKLKKRGISLSYDESVTDAMVQEGVNPVEGARGLARIRRDKIEDALSDTLLGAARWPRGTAISMTWNDGKCEVLAKRPTRTRKKTTKKK